MYLFNYKVNEFMITKFKIFENVQYSKKVLKTNDIPEDDEGYLEIKDMLKSNLGYLGKFTEWFIEQNTSISFLKTLYKEL